MQSIDITTLSDEALCARYAGGDREAGDLLAQRNARLVRCVARPYFLAGGDREDLIQEGMLGLLKAIRTFEAGRASFRTYAAQCIRSRIYDAIKRSQGKNQQILSTALRLDHSQDDSPAEWLYDPETDPEALIIHRDEQRQIAAELDALLSGYEKRVLSLYLEGYSESEMARRCNRPVKSIDNAVTRIRNKLSPRLKQGAENAPGLTGKTR
ncbi:MAG: sigma-70 family RNA polymerase sigma factor [Clostridiales bacterium]|jgi:RNA polymerase sporulation-specific sigma factor|nr:sigma-70 family RNA polymerase sigma factor [Clostridiales bacterium]